jgi:tRNA1(Val) A37 N6-methylase TrmN6
METTFDAFLSGQLTVEQPKSGYRAATDPVFLAASVIAKPNQTILDVGCGVGVASLCLGKRIPDLSITGLEVQTEYAALATKNAISNKIDLDVVTGDLFEMPKVLKEYCYDIVITNPPYFDLESGTLASDGGKAIANSAEFSTSDWTRACLKRLRPKGWIYIIQTTSQLPQILSALVESAGDIRIKPIASREQRAAKRVIVAARKGSAAPMQLLAPFVVHHGLKHVIDGSDYSQDAENILRKGHPLIL